LNVWRSLEWEYITWRKAGNMERAARGKASGGRFRKRCHARKNRLSLECLEDRRVLAVIGPTLDLASLGSLGFTIDGATASGFAGYSVAPAGDMNNDGFADVVVGAHNATNAGRTQAGETYVVFGAASGIPASVDAAALNGTNGFRLRGAEGFDRSGFSVHSAGDVNGDTIDDLLIGSFDLQATAGLDQVGQAFVVFGRTTAFPSLIDLASMSASVGFQIRGQSAFDNAGRAVSAAGDVNGDGIGDILVGAPEASPNGNIRSGQVYVVFGRTTGFGSLITPSSLNGTNGFVINGAATGDYAGFSLSSAGDVNGDGFDDILVGAERADPGGRIQAGSAYVVFGKGTPFAAQLNLSALDGTNGFALSGGAEDDFAGRSVGSAGDVNGDGFDDIIVGAPEHRTQEALRIGRAHVVFGRGVSFPAEISLASLDGANGFTLVGIDPGDRAGRSVDGAGDVNGDGFDDLIVGAMRGDPLGRTDAGEAYLVFGKPSGFAAQQSLAALDGLNGMTIQGAAANDLAGLSVAGAGDVNGDGFDDVVIGAYFGDPSGRTDAGRGYVVFGGEFNELAFSVGELPASREGEASAFDIEFENYNRPHLLSIDWGDGRVEQIALDAATSSFRPTHVYADNGSYDVSITLADQQTPSRVATGSVNIDVENAAPSIGPIAAQHAHEGTLFSLTGVSIMDAGFANPLQPGGPTEESFTYQINWGDGSPVAVGAATITVVGSPGVATRATIPAVHYFADNGTYRANLIVTDDDGGSASIPFDVVVANQAPTIVLAGPTSAPEGSLVTISATLSDSGFDNPNHPTAPSQETLRYLIFWGDGVTTPVQPVPTITPGGPGQATSGYFEASHHYADGGSYEIVVLVSDDDSGTAIQGRNISITNVAPQVFVVGNQVAQQGVELSIVDMATFVDPGFSNPNVSPATQESFTYTINWGDGSPLVTGTPTIDVPGGPGIPTQGSLDGAHTYLVTGTFTVTVTVRDDEAGSHAGTFQVQVGGVPPALGVPTDKSTTEAATLSIPEILTFTDSDAGQFTYSIDWGDGTEATTGIARRGEAFAEDLNMTNLSGAGTASRIPHPRADLARQALASLASNGTATESFDSLPAGPITIPRFLNIGGQTAVLSAGQSIRSQPSGTLNGAFPTSGDKFLFVDIGPVGPVFSIDFAQPQIGLGFYVTDAENPGNISVEFVLADGSTTIRRLLPTMASPLPGNINDGSVAYYGLVDPHHPFIRFTMLRNEATNDGFGIDDFTLVLPGATGEPIANSTLFAVPVNSNTIVRSVVGGSHVYADSGVYTATVTITDASGASSSQTFAVNVGNLAPTLDLTGSGQSTEGSSYQMSLGSVVDAGSDTVSEWRIDWNDGSPIQVFASPPGTVPHVFADGPAQRSVQVTLVDEDGQYVAATHLVSVANVAPVVEVGAAATIDAGVAVLRGGSFTDPGSDTWTAEVDYGDGGGFVPLMLAANKQFALSLNYATPGSRTVTVRITDDDGGVGTDSFPVVVRSALPTLTLDPALTLGWMNQFGTSANDEARAIAIDAVGNSYFAGYTVGDLVTANLGSNDVLLGKVDSEGNRLWTLQFGTPESDIARGVAVDADGNVFVSGDTTGGLGGENAGETDAFLSKYSADGELIWARQLGTTAVDVNRGIAIDRDGHVYVVGGTNGNLGGNNLGGLDAYIAKYDNDGNLLWTRNIGTVGDNDSLVSVAVDAEGNVYGGGVTNGNLGGPNAGALDVFVVRYDGDGNRIWVRQIGTSAEETGHSVAVDASGNVYSNGVTAGSLAGPNQGSNDYHIHKFDSEGTLLWARQNGTTASEQPRGFSVDADGNAIIAGFTAGSLARPNMGANDVFLARYNAAGESQGIMQFGTSASDLSWGASVDAAGNVYLATISQGSLAANHAGGWDVVLAKLSTTSIATEGTPLVAVDLATFSDFDVGNYAYSIDWGDGTPASSGLATVDVTDGQPNTLKLGSFDGLHTYVDNGQYHVVVRLSDPTGRTSVRSFFATVANASPTVALAAAADVDEGEPLTLTLGAVVDPGADTVSRWRVDWNDGSPVEEYSSPPGTIEHVFSDGPATRNITVSLVDEDGVHIAGVHAVSVRNVAPIVDAGEDIVLDAGQTAMRMGSFSDPGNDTWTAEVDYGNGAGFVPLAVSAENNFELALQYATPGVRTVQVRVTDDDGGIGTDSFLVSIVPTFLVASLTPTATGFVAAFNRPVDRAFVNLYDGPDVENEPTDVMLVGNAVGAVAGSLVWNAAGNQLTFIKTGGPLAADTYSVTLASRQFGFVDLEGNLLDGNGDFSAGGDFVGGFSIASTSARVVGLPDFVRGPAQAVHVPNTATGLPIRLSDGGGVLSLDLDVIYDPALLNISVIGRGANMPASWTVTTNLTQPGRARVTASGVVALAAGPLDALRITASVPGNAPIGAAQVVRLENVRVNGGLIASVGDAALHKVAFLADVDGNFAYTAFDAAFISRVVVGFDTGFDAFPLVDPVIVGNSSGTGSLSGLDAAYVAQKAVFLPRPEIPDLPPNLPAPSPAAIDPAIGVPAAVIAQPGASARVPVTVDNLDGLFGVTFRVNYETGPLDLSNEQVTLASEMEEAGWSLVQNVDDANGVAYLAAFSAEPGAAGGATLLDLSFDSLTSATGTTPLDLSGPASDGGFAFTYVDGTLTFATPGDVNLDGSVGLADLVALQRHFGKLADAVWTEGDLDGDGDVDRADVAILAANFGRQSPPAASPKPSEAIVAAAPKASTLAARRRSLSTRTADAVWSDSQEDHVPSTMRRMLSANERSLPASRRAV
jgi:hypothetical protein